MVAARVTSVVPSGRLTFLRGTLAAVIATTTFTDYFVLLEVNGEWKIANKVYHAARQSPSGAITRLAAAIATRLMP